MLVVLPSHPNMNWRLFWVGKETHWPNDAHYSWQCHLPSGLRCLTQHRGPQGEEDTHSDLLACSRKEAGWQNDEAQTNLTSKIPQQRKQKHTKCVQMLFWCNTTSRWNQDKATSSWLFQENVATSLALRWFLCSACCIKKDSPRHHLSFDWLENNGKVL